MFLSYFSFSPTALWSFRRHWIHVTKGEHFPSSLARDRQNLEARGIRWCHHCKAGASCCSGTQEWGTCRQDTSGSCVPHSSSNLPPGAWTRGQSPHTGQAMFLLFSPLTEPALGGEGLSPFSLSHCPHTDTAQVSCRRTLFPLCWIQPLPSSTPKLS